MSDIILIDNNSEINFLDLNTLQQNNTKIFALNIEVHKILEKDGIKHFLPDELLSKNERIEIFDDSIKFLTWYSDFQTEELLFEEVNLLRIFDTQELHSFIMPILIKLFLIKKIIESENPLRIIASQSISKIIRNLSYDKNIHFEFIGNKIKDELFWDSIDVKYQIGPITLSWTLSKNKYFKIKKIIEFFIHMFNNFSFNINSNKRKSILFLEFNTEHFSKLFHHMADYDGNIILVNRRRPTIFSYDSYKIIKKTGCKILDFENILSAQEKQRTKFLVEEYMEKLEKFWNESSFENYFIIKNCKFWNIIKETLIRKYEEKIEEFILLILIAKKLFQKLDIRGIISLNEIGETEKTFLEFKKKTPSILLEHGFFDTVDELNRYHELFFNFKDLIAVWGDVTKNRLVEKNKIDSKKILVSGSPRHDSYFDVKNIGKKSKQHIVLIAPNPITAFSGLSSTTLELRFEETLKKTILTLKSFHNVKIVIKLHQIQLEHNKKISSIVKSIDKKIPIYSTQSTIEIIRNVDTVIVISPEGFGTSTMLLESMILQKPTMNIILDNNIPEFLHIKLKTILAILDKEEFLFHFKKILFDDDFRISLINNANYFLKEFLKFHGNSSEKFSLMLKSL